MTESELTGISWKKSTRSGGSNNCVEVGWRKSSRSSGQGACIEVGRLPELVGVRDTKDRDGGTLAIHTDAWQSFLTALRQGRYQH